MKPPKQRRVSLQQNRVIDATVETELQEFVVEQRRLLVHKRPDRATEGFQRLVTLLQDSNLVHINDNDILKQIHGILTLTLAYAVSFGENLPDHTSCLQLLCRCLINLYQTTLPEHLFNSEECSESFCLLLQVVVRLQDQSTSLLKCCIEILQLLAAHARLDLPYTFQKRGLLYLVQLCKRNEGNIIWEQIMLLLRSLTQQQSPRTSQSAQTALYAIDEPSKSKAVDHVHRDNIFYIQCLLSGSKNVNESTLGVAVIAQLLEATLGHKFDESQAIEAADCLARIAQNGPASRTLKKTLLRALIETNKVEVRLCLIPGIWSDLAEQSWTDLIRFDDIKQVQGIISALFEVISNYKGDEKNIRMHGVNAATSMLLEVLDLIESYRLNLKAVSRGDLMHICAVFLQHENKDIVFQTINLLSRWIRKDGVSMVELYPEVLSALADVLDSSFSSFTMKHTIIVLFNEILQQNNDLATIMARQPKVLEALVGIAASETESESKRLALSILSVLSNSACNRRIMAKQLGLIACLIRYVRGLEDESEIESALRREAMKKNIMQLAEAL